MNTRTQLRIDTYFDITCDNCARSWSTDFNCDARQMARSCIGGGMGMAQNKATLTKLARSSGWRCFGGRTLCPECFEAARKEKNP